MKKLLCIVVSAILLLSVVWCPNASAVENRCALFDVAINRLRWHAPFWNVTTEESFPVASIVQYTREHFFTEAYGELKITVGEYTFFATYAVPAAEFETAAKNYFAVVNIDALRNYTSFFWDYENDTGIDGFQHYQPDRDVYLFSAPGGMGDTSWYEILGYTEENGCYTVYSRFLSLVLGQPKGVEGEDYVQIGEDFYAVEHYLRNVMTISNGNARFHSWEEMDSMPDVDLTGPLQALYQSQELILETEEGVFPDDAVFEITVPAEKVLNRIQKALSKKVSQFVAYEIQASAQPEGAIQATFVFEEAWDPAKLALFYIPEEGEPQRLEAAVDPERGVIIAQLTNLGTYALAELREADPVMGDVDLDGQVNALDARLLLRYVAGLVEEEKLELSLADVNGDGKVNARDAREILWKAAGLDG